MHGEKPNCGFPGGKYTAAEVNTTVREIGLKNFQQIPGHEHMIVERDQVDAWLVKGLDGLIKLVHARAYEPGCDPSLTTEVDKAVQTLETCLRAHQPRTAQNVDHMLVKALSILTVLLRWRVLESGLGDLGILEKQKLVEYLDRYKEALKVLKKAS